MTLKVIAYARNGHTDKFGIPRQSREESPILTRIVFEPEFAVKEALRGIEGYSHLWILWGFSESERLKVKSEREEGVESQKVLASTPTNVESNSWSPTVRPPRLGGNKRMGVFATRSPFRPNPIGLSSVKLVGIQHSAISHQLELIVSGADVLDGTPIYDIKPYLSFSDSHPDAKNGFAEETKDYQLDVNWGSIGLITDKSPNNHLIITYYSPNGPLTLPRRTKEELEYILAQDPRPAYHDDSEREYKLDYAGLTVTFTVENRVVYVKNIEKA